MAVRCLKHVAKEAIVTGGSEVCEMADKEVKRGPAGSLFEAYMTDR